MKYPYIGECINGVVLFSGKGIGAAIEKERGAWASTEMFEFSDGWDEFDFKNITRECLPNTWGVVESKEHAEFIIELAELHGFGVWNSHKIDCGESIEMFFFCPVDNALQLYHNDISSSMIKGEKKITIPLPPKAEVSEAGHNLVFAANECKEWPCVNDEVESISTGNIYKVLAVGVNQVCVEYHNKTLRVLSLDAIQKPKTPEEALRDEVTEVIWKANEQWGNSKGERQISVQEFVAIALLTKYNIAPKD